MDSVSVYQVSNNSLIAGNVGIANTFVKRFFGLMCKQPLAQGQGLYIQPCQQIHTHFMRFAIDVVFLDGQMRVLHVEHNMKPWKISRYYKAANSVLELAPHQAQTIRIGDALRFVPNT